MNSTELTAASYCRFTSAAAIFVVLVFGQTASAENAIYKTNKFTFEIPKPWYYAIPSRDKKNVARCFLKSRLRLTAKGRFIVDAGGAADEMPKILDGMASVMRPKESKFVVTRREVKLGGSDAVLLTSDAKDYYTPCAIIVCMHNNRLYMAMLSVSETEDLTHRDAMVQALLKTWNWLP